MPAYQENSSEKIWGLFCRSLVFFILFYFYTWLVIEPHLIYHGFGMTTNFPVFSVGWLFFKGFLAYPGGLAQYASALLSQWYYYSWAGALIMTLIAALLYLGMRLVIKITRTVSSMVIYFVPPLLLLIMYHKYSHPLTTSLTLLGGIFCFILYKYVSGRNLTGRIVVFLSLLVILYYIAAGASLLYTVLVAIYEIIAKRRLIFVVPCLLGGLAVPWLIGNCIFFLQAPDTYLSLLPFNPALVMRATSWMKGIYLFVIFAVLTVTVWENFLREKLLASGIKSENTSKSQQPADSLKRFENSRLTWVLRAATPFIVAVLICIFVYDSKAKRFFQMNYLASGKMWPQLLELARTAPQGLYFIYWNHDINRALYYSDRLGDDMFSYSQALPALLLTSKVKKERLGLEHIKISNLLLEFGNVNWAEKHAYEALAKSGNCPFILQHLALINMVKRQTENARVFLNILSKDLIYGKRAKNMLRRLDKDPQLTTDEHVQHIRSIMYDKDNPNFMKLSLDNQLLEFLESKPNNRMVFEYLMAYYLLTRQVDKVAENIERLDDLGYKNIPRHYEEALLLYMTKSGKKVDLQRYKIRQDTLHRHAVFAKTFKRFGNNKRAAWHALVKNFGHSYYFYFVFGVSGVIR